MLRYHPITFCSQWLIHKWFRFILIPIVWEYFGMASAFCYRWGSGCERTCKGDAEVWGCGLRDRRVTYWESLDPWWIVSTYFAVRAETRKLQIRTREPLPGVCWCEKTASNQPADPYSAPVWRVLWPPQGYCSVLPSLSENPLHVFGECIFLNFFWSTHSSSSRFSLCHLWCLHTLAWFTKKLCTAARTQSFVRSYFSEHS